MTNIPNPSQLRTQARPAPDCMPGRHCERHARGLGGCIAGECNRPAPAAAGHPLPPAKVQAYADSNGLPPSGGTALKRPECFDVALEFLGDPEATELRRYVEALEGADAREDALRVAGAAGVLPDADVVGVSEGGA